MGDSVARVRERRISAVFLTGNAITLGLDVLFSVVFIAVMFVYSGLADPGGAVSLPLYFIVSLHHHPLAARAAERELQPWRREKAFLVETINGIDTLKSMAVEPQITRKWDNSWPATWPPA